MLELTLTGVVSEKFEEKMATDPNWFPAASFSVGERAIAVTGKNLSSTVFLDTRSDPRSNQNNIPALLPNTRESRLHVTQVRTKSRETKP